jgi:hypothetical protein
MSTPIARYILAYLMAETEFAETWLPHFKADLFPDDSEGTVFKLIRNYRERFKTEPSQEILCSELQRLKGINEDQFKAARELILTLPHPNSIERDWVFERTLQFWQERTNYNAIRSAIAGLDAKKATQITDALSVVVESMKFDPRSLGDDVIIPVRKLIETYSPPDYLIDRLFKRGYLYGITGATGSGKTAVALALAMSVAKGQPVGDRQVRKGRVVYFAGENPDDVRARLAGMLDKDNGDEDIPLSVCEQATRDGAEKGLTRLLRKNEAVALLIIDTSAAYFAGEDENDNKQALDHAKWLRNISARVPGNPAVLVCCHPHKGAERDELIPRGGSAFVNELDGNLSCEKAGDFSVLRTCGKYRDVDFPPIAFHRQAVYPQRLNGMPTVVARYADEEEAASQILQFKENDLEVLTVLAQDHSLSQRDIAERLLWYTSTTGEPDHKKSGRSLKRLREKGALDDGNRLTPIGRSLLESTGGARGGRHKE